MLTKFQRVNSPSRQRKQQGFSLIEVLVSMVLLSFGLLGMAGLFNYAISSNKNASSRMAASILAADFAELVRANPDGFALGSYNRVIAAYSPTASTVDNLPTSLCSYPNCTSSNAATTGLAFLDVAMFRNRVKASLPAGDFEAQRVGASNQFDIWIVWAEGKGGNAANDTEKKSDNCPTSVSQQAPAPDPYPRCLFTRVAL
jgi:type IV pilus assembly protein PilV